MILRFQTHSKLYRDIHTLKPKKRTCLGDRFRRNIPQSISSEPSVQSISPSQTWNLGTHPGRSRQLNSRGLHSTASAGYTQQRLDMKFYLIIFFYDQNLQFKNHYNWDLYNHDQIVAAMREAKSWQSYLFKGLLPII